jgi:hypothetical protein
MQQEDGAVADMNGNMPEWRSDSGEAASGSVDDLVSVPITPSDGATAGKDACPSQNVC